MGGSDQLDDLVDRLHLDQRSRWLSGQCVGAEWYLDRHPVLRTNRECLISLVYGEYCLRDDLADGPESHDYMERFPEVADELGRLFDVDGELTSSGLTGVAGTAFPRRLNWPGKNKPLVLIDDRADAVFPPASAAGLAALRPGYLFYSLAADGESDESRCSGVDAFQPLRILGSGSTGVVYAAKRRNSNQRVAVKFITLGPYETSELANLFSAVRAVAELSHPGMVRIHEVSAWNELPYVVLDRVDGPSLATLLGKRSLTPLEATRVASSVATTLTALHAGGIAHGNLKPANVLIDGEGVVRLCDACMTAHLPKAANFGCLLSEPPPGKTLAERMRQLARGVRRPTDTALVRHESGYLIGHPSYLAPEQLSGKSAGPSPSADIYSLGALWYASLTGRPPFQQRRWQATLSEVSQSATRPPAITNVAVPAIIGDMVLRCLSRDPALRPTAAELSDTALLWLAQQPNEPFDFGYSMTRETRSGAS
jgi:serine/threonine protein kinase